MPFRHNEFNVNLALADFQYAGQSVHARMAFQTGTYAQANYTLEDAPLQNLHEVYAGVRLGRPAGGLIWACSVRTSGWKGR